MSPALMWLIVGLGLLIIELFTMTFFLMWIACGALLAAVAAFFTTAAWVPWMVFSVSTVVLLIATRPLARSLHGSVTVPSNVDRFVGRTAVVLETIDNLHNTGRVRIESDEWRARSAGGAIAEGQHVIVDRVEGTTLIVEDADAKASATEQ